ncbi:hypothetical protein Tco_1530698 [Tanacetum coccineum]
MQVHLLRKKKSSDCIVMQFGKRLHTLINLQRMCLRKFNAAGQLLLLPFLEVNKLVYDSILLIHQLILLVHMIRIALMTFPTTPNTRIHKDHPIKNVIGDVKSSVQTRRMTKPTFEQGFLSAIEPTSIAKALYDSSWVEAMQEELLQFKLQQLTYTDSDYAGATQDRKSTIGGCQFLGNRLISWQCKKQTVVATSTTEAEYVAAASCCG